jgi:hypothetical protein
VDSFLCLRQSWCLQSKILISNYILINDYFSILPASEDDSGVPVGFELGGCSSISLALTLAVLLPAGSGCGGLDMINLGFYDFLWTLLMIDWMY